MDTGLYCSPTRCTLPLPLCTPYSNDEIFNVKPQSQTLCTFRGLLLRRDKPHFPTPVGERLDRDNCTNHKPKNDPLSDCLYVSFWPLYIRSTSSVESQGRDAYQLAAPWATTSPFPHRNVSLESIEEPGRRTNDTLKSDRWNGETRRRTSKPVVLVWILLIPIQWSTVGYLPVFLPSTIITDLLSRPDSLGHQRDPIKVPTFSNTLCVFFARS